MNSNCDSNAEAKRTKEMLAEMIEKGDAMNCPVCQVRKKIIYFFEIKMKRT